MSQRPPTAAATTASDSPLVNTYWKLAELNGAPVTVAANQREPYIILQMQDNRFVGSGGVNRLLGTYKVEGDKLTLLPGPGTLMAGPPEAMKQEDAFIDAMRTVTWFTITGDELTMRAGEDPVMKFKAVALR